MIHPDTTLRFVGAEVGVGVLATAFIPAGTIVWTRCALDQAFTPSEAAALPALCRAALDRYSYVLPSTERLLCWDDARFVNHSCDPVMLDVGANIEIAARDLRPGDELTCEYAMLNLKETLECSCGAANCRGTIRADDTLRLWREWDQRLAAVFPRVAAVAQPLMPFVGDPAALIALIEGRAPLPSYRDGHAP